jgi:hypothetical protein
MWRGFGSEPAAIGDKTMSEYQYYEFQAIDRPLAEKEMRELRSYSTRANITPTSFTVDYSWGDFKGDEDAWMAKYFDAFLHLANWGTDVLKLSLSSRLLAPKTAKLYCRGDEHAPHEGRAHSRRKDAGVGRGWPKEHPGQDVCRRACRRVARSAAGSLGTG